MLNHDENELMCRVGPGSAMRDALRRYWLPALVVADIPVCGGDPLKVQLLGQTYVAFRDTRRRVGFLDEACRHRSASLALGRTEGDGTRCIYHGWKFAFDGEVLETPNVSDAGFKTRFKGRAYPTREAGGLIWVYLGEAEQMPPFPDWEYLSLPPAHLLPTRHILNCNFVQVLEGLVDSSHLGILHMDELRNSAGSDLDYAKKLESMQFDLAPRLEVETTDFGFYCVASRGQSAGAEELVEARVAAFVAPCHIFNPNGDIATIVVPNSDTKSTFFHVFWSKERKIGEEPLRSEQLRFVGLDADALSAFGLSPAGRRPIGAPDVDIASLQDRAAMKRGEQFSGFPGIIQEDAAVSVSSGPIRDRSNEMLSAADIGVAQLNRTLLECARRVRRGEDPIGAQPVPGEPEVAGCNGVLKPGDSWRSLVKNRAGADIR